MITCDTRPTAAEQRALAAQYRRNADELWHLFSLTADPVAAARLSDDARQADNVAAILNQYAAELNP